MPDSCLWQIIECSLHCSYLDPRANYEVMLIGVLFYLFLPDVVFLKKSC